MDRNPGIFQRRNSLDLDALILDDLIADDQRGAEAKLTEWNRRQRAGKSRPRTK